MMELTVNVNVKAPELAEAIVSLATVFSGVKPTISVGAIKPEEGTRAADKTTKPTTQKTKETVAPPEEKKEDPPEEEKAVTLEVVRAKLAELTRAGKPIKELINKFGASKLSEIPADKYAEVLKESEGL